MSRFLKSYALAWILARLLVGILISATLYGAMVVIGGPCRLGSIYLGVFIGGGFGPAITISLYSGLRHRSIIRALLWFLLISVPSLLAVSILLPGTFGAIHRGKRLKAMADMRAIGRSLEAGSIPSARVDPWGAPYVVDQRSDGYRIVSYGECSQPDVPPGSAYPEGVTSLYEADLVYSDGVFLRYPEGEQP